MSKRLSVPGPRDLRATLDGTGERDRLVVACPPHPQMRGDRHDGRLQAVSDALVQEDIDCLRFDYGSWDEGRAERRDVRTAIGWGRDRYDRVGLFGFSFGGAMALLASVPAGSEPTADVVSVLAPAAQVTDEHDVVDALDSIQCPVQVVYGERDETAEWEPVVERARERGYVVDSLPADHFFVGQQTTVADTVVPFIVNEL
jgi:alpha/beta superfamily hydrolase